MSKGEFVIWYVQGDPEHMLWATKLDAEKYARELFPEETESKRYARIFCRRVDTYED